jgi:hypothetical protein
LGWQVRLFGVKLVAFAFTDNFFRIAQCCWPVKSLSESFSDQGAWRSVVSADPGVYLEKELLALGNRDALHENASLGGAAFVEFGVDYNEGFGSSGYPTGCIAFLREDFVEEISQ